MVKIQRRENGETLHMVEGDTLAGANLWEARLSGADLRGHDLRGAMLWRANLTNADLRGADLRGAVLLGAILWGADLTGVTWDRTTRWPDDFDPANIDPGSAGEAGWKGCRLKSPGLTAVLCRKALHRVERGRRCCPHCLQSLWWGVRRTRRDARATRAEASLLRERAGKARLRAEALVTLIRFRWSEPEQPALSPT
jgi:hypothetical protein